MQSGWQQLHQLPYVRHMMSQQVCGVSSIHFCYSGSQGTGREYTLGRSPVNHMTHKPFTNVHVFGLWEETEGFGENPRRHGENINEPPHSETWTGLEESFYEVTVPTGVQNSVKATDDHVRLKETCRLDPCDWLDGGRKCWGRGPVQECVGRGGLSTAELRFSLPASASLSRLKSSRLMGRSFENPRHNSLSLYLFIISGAHIHGDHRYMGWIQVQRLHVRGEAQQHKTHLSRTVSGSAYGLPLKTFPAHPLMWLSSPTSFTIQNVWMNVIRHNRNATHLFEPSKQCLASLETRWRFHTQNNKSLHSEIAVTPHKRIQAWLKLQHHPPLV